MAELRIARSELVLGSDKAWRADELAAAWLAQDATHRAVVDDPREVAHAIGAYGGAETLVVVDCLTLSLTAQLMDAGSLADALARCAGPIVILGSDSGDDLARTSPDARNFIDSLDTLNQEAAAACERVTLMTAGHALILKGMP